MPFSKTNKNKSLYSSLFLLFPTIAMVVFLNLFFIIPAQSATDTICPLKTNQDFKLGDIHEDIRSFQKYLNNNGYILASSGPGSPGRETNYFGTITKDTLIKFQQANNLPTTGVLDSATRNFLDCITKTTSFVFQKDFKEGDIHEDIRDLQKYLNNNGFILAQSGPGSPGRETNYFGSVTKAALIKFQQAKGLATTGNLELQTRNFLNGITTKVIPFVFQRDFKLGDIHEDIRQLQKYLNNNGYILASSGPGSPGRETNYFGSITKATLIKFQQANGLLSTGNLDLATRNKINKVSGGGSSAPVVSPTPTPPPVITPTPDTLYSISGSLTGCIGPITIKNNGKDNINIKVGDSSNFTFPTKLSNNSTYNVTVETSYPGQVCYINKSVGIIANNNITDLKIACGLNLTYDPFKYIPSSGGARVVTYLLSYTAGSNGTISGEASQTINQETDGTEVIAVADSNYHFVSWSDGITTANRTDTNITDNLSVTASFAINTYLVTFKDHDGTILSTSTVNHGSDASTPIDPTRTGYTFTGWDTAYTNITTTTIITAQYSINSYTISFDSDGGSSVSSITQNYNTAVTPPSNPTKTGYTFDSWSPTLPANMPASSATHTAQWNINSYTVTFENWDTVFISSSSVNYGSGATAPADPSRIGYTFTGWDVAFNNITSDLTVTAQYSINQYTISFNSDGGSIVSSITQDYDTAITPPVDPTKTGYTFSTWTPSLPATMPEYSATHTAIWDINYYTVTFVDYNSSFISSSSVAYNSSTTPPSDPSRIGYTFTGWDSSDYLNVTSDLTIQATYNINTFTVNYTAGTGGIISGNASQTVDYNSSTTQVVAIPDSGYTFINWNDSFASPTRTDSNISDNATYTARFGFINISSPTNSEEIVIDTDFTISGTSSNLSSVTAEISTNTIDWVTLGTTSTLSDTWSITAQISSTLFSAGVIATIRVKSVIYNNIYDEVEIILKREIEYPYAMRDASNIMRYSKTLDLSTDIITGFTMSASINLGGFVYDGEYVYSLLITSSTSVTVTKHNMITGTTITSYNFNPTVDITNKIEFYSRNNKIYLFWQDGSNVKFKIFSRSLAVETEGTLEALVNRSISLNDIGRGIIDVGSQGIFVAVSNISRGFMDYNMYDFNGNFVKVVRETSISNSTQYDYVNIMCFQDGKVGLYDKAPTDSRLYVYDANGNDLATNFSFNGGVILNPTNNMYRYSFIYSRTSVNTVQEFGSTGLLGSMTDYAYARRGFVKAF